MHQRRPEVPREGYPVGAAERISLTHIFMEAKRRTQLRLAVLAAGIAFLAAGIFRGEFSDVLAKAMRICLECIGIG